MSKIQTKLFTIEQKYNETVRSFAHRLERLTVDLNDACISCEGQDASGVVQNLNKKSCLESFQEGLKAPIKLIIKASSKANQVVNIKKSKASLFQMQKNGSCG